MVLVNVLQLVRMACTEWDLEPEPEHDRESLSESELDSEDEELSYWPFLSQNKQRTSQSSASFCQ